MSNFSAKLKNFFVRQKDKGEKSLLTKQAIAIIICLAAVAVGLTVYFIWAKPAEESLVKPDYLYDGEVFDESASKLMMFPQRERDVVESIEISNSKGKYTLLAYVEDGYTKYRMNNTNIYIKSNALDGIISDTEKTGKDLDESVTLISGTVAESALANYGITLDSANFVSAEKGGKTYRFIFGNSKTLDSGYKYYIAESSGNGDGTYSVYTLNALTSSTQFRIKDFASTTLDTTSVSTVVVSSIIVSTITPSTKSWRVTENALYEDLAQYGLDEESSPSWVRVTLYDGSSYRFFIGDKIPSAGGFYAMAEDRKNDGKYIVYIITSASGNALCAGSESLLGLNVTSSLGDSAASMTDFRLYRDGNMIIRCGLATSATATAGTSSYTMIYPSSYMLDENTYYDSVLSSLSYITASEVMSFGERIHTEEIYSKYGLDLDKDRLAAGSDGNHAKIMFTATGNPEDKDYSVIYFGKKQTDSDGTEFYYVYSPEYEMIYKLSGTGFEFVEWSVAKFTRGTLYFNYINCTDYFELVSNRLGVSVRYTMSGNEKTLKALISEAGENGKPLSRINSDGDEVEGEFHVEYTIKTVGTYTTTEYKGDFENFRSLFYVLITRALAIEEDASGLLISDTPSYHVNVMETPDDQPMSYTRYDKGEKVYYTDSSGNRHLAQVRYAGGNIVCRNIIVTASDGTVLKYDTGYYDEAEGKFFLKVESTNDGNLKPANYRYDDDNNLVVSTYLPATTTGEYTKTLYEYALYDVYNVYTDADGKQIKQINQTYKVCIPTTTEYTYRIEADGSQTLISEHTETSETGTLIRTQMVEKLFADSEKLLSGVDIQRENVD